MKLKKKTETGWLGIANDTHLCTSLGLCSRSLKCSFIPLTMICTTQGAFRNWISVYVCTFGLWNVMFQSCVPVCSLGGNPMWPLPITHWTSPYNFDFTVHPPNRAPRSSLPQYGWQAGGCHPTEMPSRLFLQVRSLRRRIRKRTNRTQNRLPSTTSSAETSRPNPSPVNGFKVSSSRSFTSVWVQGH